LQVSFIPYGRLRGGFFEHLSTIMTKPEQVESTKQNKTKQNKTKRDLKENAQLTK